MSALNFDVCRCLCLNIMLRFTNSWKTEQTSCLTFGPKQFAGSVFMLSVRIPCFIIYVARLVARLSSGIEVPPFLQLAPELL